MAVTCLAPWLSLRFSPNGEVHACCVNDTYALGRVDRDRLADVWNGARLGVLRDAISRVDASLGCEDCAVDDDLGRRASSHASHYDQFIGRPATGWPLRLEFAMSNTCNLMCSHCNGDLSSAIRRRREQLPPLPDLYGEQFFADIRPFLEHVEVTAFLGGEPFLGRHARRVWDHMIDIGRDVEVNVTTNGTIWNSEVERYVRSLRMNVAVSIDSVHRDTFEAIRVGADFDTVMATRDRLFALTSECGSAFTINHCLLRENAHELHDMLSDADRRGMRVQIIPITYPPHHSPFTLPSEQLREVVAGLRRAEAERGPITLNSEGWERSLRQLTDAADDPGQGGAATATAVQVGMPQRRLEVLDPTDLLAESIADQTEFGNGMPPLRLEIVDGSVSSVDAPEWSIPLAPHAWMGLRDDQILGAMCDQVAGEPSWEVRKRWGGVTEVDLTIAGESGEISLRVHFFDWPDGGRPRRVFVVASADLALAG